MTASRWELVKSLFQSALNLRPEERPAFLAQHCGADEEIYREVESLLHSLDQTGEFLEEPVLSVNEVLGLPVASPDLAGQRVGAYEIVREIGRGGMGAVYLAVRADNEFRKRVAIKLIRGGMESDFIIRRFRNERQILARLEHPNIARLIDGGTTTEGLPYFVMEFVEGDPLVQYCESKSLPLRDRLEIFLQACSAVHYAHRRMIVHRDLKPGNILVKQDATPKLLDFGIAKLLDPETSDTLAETMVGYRLATPAYSSPEQMRGEAATAASDIYALGIILFELITGRRPSMPGGNDPLGLDGTTSDSAGVLSRQLRAVVHKAIQPDPAERYSSVEEFSSDIRACLAGETIPNYATAPTSQKKIPAPVSAGSVAILPFRLLGGDSAPDGYLGLGITDALITKLSNVGRISVRSTSAVMKYTTVADARVAGHDLCVEFILEGRIQRVAERVRVTVQLIRVIDDTPVWAASFNEQFEDLLRMEDSISEQVARALVPQLTGEEREQLARRGTGSAKAHEAYLRGRWHWNKGTEESLAQALLSFMKAIADDPEYALAHAGVADYYVQLGIRGGPPPAESFAAAKEYASTALRLDSSLAEAHASLGFAVWAHDRDQNAAAHHFQLAIAFNPDYAPAHHWLGLLNATRGRPEMAVACLDRARKLDPNRPIYAADLALCHYVARRYGRAIDCCLKAIQAFGEHSEFYSTLALSYHFDGQREQAMQAAERTAELAGHDIFSLCVVAEVEARHGDQARAKALLTEVKARSESGYVSGYALALLHLACRDRRAALDELERAWRDRDWWLLWIGVGPSWDELRGNSRFSRLLTTAPPQTERMGLPDVGPRVPSLRILWRRLRPLAAAALLLLVAGLAYWVTRSASSPFQKTVLTRLTTSGTALRSAISPDGRYVAYTANEGGEPIVFVRELNGSAAYRLAGPVHGEIHSLQFIRDGRYVAFLEYLVNEPANGTLRAVPLGGGGSETLMSSVPGPESVSPDGSKIAYYKPTPQSGTDDLYIRNVDGSGERKLLSQRYPDRFSLEASPSWSFDGRRVVCAVEGTDASGHRIAIIIVGLDGSVHPVAAPRWQWVGRLAWLKDGSGFLVIGQEKDSPFQQIWFVPPGRGKAVRLTNDLNEYHSLDVVGDASALVSVQVQTLTNILISSPAEMRITPADGRYFDLIWTPDGRIMYASDASASADIWSMNADGADQRRFTEGIGRNYSPAVSPDGRLVAFHSNRDGNWNIWRMDLTTRTSVRLTEGTRDSNWPQFTPDGKWVVYHHTGLNAMFNIWKVPVEGGPAVQMTNQLTMHPAVSPKDGRIACWYSADTANPNWKIAILGPEGGRPLILFDVPSTVIYDSRLRWTPQADGITYVDRRNGIGNLWVQPVDGKPAHQLTSFQWGQVFSYDWSPDGRLVYSRGTTPSNVVLIRDTSKLKH